MQTTTMSAPPHPPAPAAAPGDDCQTVRCGDAYENVVQKTHHFQRLAGRKILKTPMCPPRDGGRCCLMMIPKHNSFMRVK